MTKLKRPLKLIGALALTAILLFGMIIPSAGWMKKTVTSARIVHNSQMSPVIFVPGSSATQNRFDELISLLNTNNRDHSLLKITVKKSGKLSITGKINRRDRQPFIVVGFEDNKDGYDNIKLQASWFDKAMNYLVDQYHFNNFSGIGHSNGGLIYTYYLEHYFNANDLTIKTLMTIGTPYNFSEKQAKNRTQMLSDFIAAKSKLPKDLTMYSVAGTEDYNDDGIVPVQSVQAGKYIYQNTVKHYTEITVTGSESQHSSLPQNRQIVQLISQYILNGDQNGANPNNPNGGAGGPNTPASRNSSSK
ncbi:cell surface hydrolase [Agrilactobacillus composti DSM 18527 = JCM 14202]|uniref:Cell surface hydrolase n=1 Tax=Agrilactobacillus composti DSM 18527 = JCM 14202 TaxID=1423734 RepID=X0PI98_9LACO|nr:alpha/beta hydrolase [Agrilactobacillus composti]KRM32926.1 cell surface hydrolase [Agrilactobacillus composti DSM 18527 = JCM 14202]GAF41924.1 cell surface hydrolase [Agrilactobacillus composti DSM 18527 = JCM 14202]